MSEAPTLEHPRDIAPGAAEFAGSPRLGDVRRRLRVGPFDVQLDGMDEQAVSSFARWARALAPAAAPSRPDVTIELLRSERDEYLHLSRRRGERTRLVTWSEKGGLAMASHHVALLADGDVERALVLVARQDDSSLDLSLQNALRVVMAWRLVRTGAGLLLHASAVDSDGGAVLFFGPSGAGKSTAARNSSPRRVLADDVALLTRETGTRGRWLLHPTPLWAETEFAGRTACLDPLPVVRAFRLDQAERPAAARLGGASAAASLLAHAPFLGDDERFAAKVPLAEDLARSVAAFRLQLANDPSFWTVIEALEDRRAGAGLAGTGRLRRSS